MQERLNWTVSKTVVAQVTVGSNPTLSVFLVVSQTISCRDTTQTNSLCYNILLEQAKNVMLRVSTKLCCDFLGAVAQLGECIPRTDEATGSNPVCSIFLHFSERCRSWLNWHDWKSCVLFCSTVGSNPTLSASF